MRQPFLLCEYIYNGSSNTTEKEGGKEMPYAPVDDTTIYYEMYGEGEPIVFIHPPAMGHVAFKNQLKLANRCKVIVFDIRGHGRSGYMKNETVTISKIAADLQKLLHYLRIQQATLCGYSYGGLIALEYAINYPEQVKKLILCSSFPEVSSFLLKQQFKAGLLFAKMNAISILGALLGLSHASQKEYKKEIKKYAELTNPNILYHLYKDGLTYKCTEKLAQIDAPILLVYGSKNKYIHKHHRHFVKRHKDTKTVFIEGTGHQIPTKHSDKFNAIIEDFVLA